MYTLNHFENYNIIALPKNTLTVIKMVSCKVGAPTYIKTPNFKKRQKPKIYWQILRNFKATKLEKKDTKIDNIQSLLNKIIDDNFIQMKIEIINKIKECNKEELNIIINHIFKIASNNVIFSSIYAKLYIILMKTFPIVEKIFDKHLNKYLTSFDLIKYIHSDDNYDEYCNYNKKNDQRKSLSTFFSNLTNLNTEFKIDIFNIIDTLINKIKKDDKNKKKENEEISENIKILVINLDKKFYKNASYKHIIQKINFYIDHKNIGITNKFKFCFMDIMDVVNTI